MPNTSNIILPHGFKYYQNKTPSCTIVAGQGLQCYECVNEWGNTQGCYEDGDENYGENIITCKTDNAVCFMTSIGGK